MGEVAATRTVFRLFACCIPVRGARRSTLCDVQRGTYHLIPTGLYEILTTYRDHTLDELRELFGPQAHPVIDEYFRFLDEQELGFWTDEPESFPELDRAWEVPEVITNAVVDVDADSAHDFAAIAAQLGDLGCRALQVRFFAPLPLAAVDAALSPTLYGPLRSLDLLLHWTEECTEEALEVLSARHRRISTIVVHSAPEDRVARLNEGELVPLLYRTERIDSHAHCGQVHPAYFSLTMRPFLEAQQFNSCLNRKVAVDTRGEIRNCPSMSRSYGNLASTTLHAAVMQHAFQEIWAVTKDQVEVCRDCEFRYVCPDCRVFVRDPGNRLSKPAKCSYDPYTAQWGADGPEGLAAAGARPCAEQVG
jgi:SPASM domain peptide maturase of grasp-with-spasm system